MWAKIENKFVIYSHWSETVVHGIFACEVFWVEYVVDDIDGQVTNFRDAFLPNLTATVWLHGCSPLWVLCHQLLLHHLLLDFRWCPVPVITLVWCHSQLFIAAVSGHYNSAGTPNIAIVRTAIAFYWCCFACTVRVFSSNFLRLLHVLGTLGSRAESRMPIMHGEVTILAIRVHHGQSPYNHSDIENSDSNKVA